MTRALALAGCLALVAEAAVTPEAESPPPSPLPGTALLDQIDALHTRVELHAAFHAGKDSWLDVGVYPVPAPRVKR